MTAGKAGSAQITTLSPDLCFVTTLAEGLWARAKGDPLALAETQIYLPTRRACRVLRDTFLRVTGAQAALLPRLLPLGDVDETELDFAGGGADLDDLLPAIPPLRRQLLLTRLIRQRDESLPWDQASALAQALASLLDQMQTENLAWDDLEKIVPDTLAQHWQQTLTFLEVLTKVWPPVLAAEGCMDPAARRAAALRAQADHWQQMPPDHPVIVAGSTGSILAVGHLMGVVARMPRGEVILPSLDLEMDEESWQAIDETHPQFTMKTWLSREGFTRADVALWHADGLRAPRVRLLREAMRPAATTEAWRSLTPESMPAAATDGIALLEMDHLREESDVIALRLRAALEVPGQTAALITPDRALAARVAAALRRWGIEADDSAGRVLTDCPVGSFLCAILDCADPQAGALQALTLLKHPLAAMGLDPAACRAAAHTAEKAVWRGVSLAGGLGGAARALRAEGMEELADWMDSLARAFAPLQSREDQPIATHVQALRLLAETLAATNTQTGGERLWRGADGEAAASWINDWPLAAVGMPEITAQDFARLFRSLIGRETVRTAAGLHPRLDLLGPLEARLIHHDVVVLGGLNEGVWPPAPPVDPWLSRPMKRDLHLPTPEKRVGLSAHDFVFLASGPQVLLTRARRVGGTPTVPSRFLLALGAVLQAARGSEALPCDQPWRAWAALLDTPDAFTPMDPPQPRPPALARPRLLPVTDIGLWKRNPYALYAKRILKLKKLDPIDADVSQADKGDVIHAALESFIRRTMKIWPADPLPLLIEEGRAAFARLADRPQVAAFWWPRFERIAKWFVRYETERRMNNFRPLGVEAENGMDFAGGFRLVGRADRIDAALDGGLEIIDYKTGSVPSQSQVFAGYEPQLPLLALMAQAQGSDIAALSYWQLVGGKVEAKVTRFDKNVPEMAEQAKEGLLAMIAAFADPQTPYLAVPKPRYAPRYDDYAHLARMAEWGRVDGGEE